MAMDFLGTNISSLNCAAWRVCYNSQPVDEVVWKSKSGTETTVFSNRFICYSNCIPNAQERYILANLSPSRVLVCCPIYAKSYDGTSKEIGKLYVEPDTSSANHMKYCFIANSTYEDKCVPITYRVCATNVSSADMDICFQPSTNWCGYLAQIVGTCTNYELYEDGGSAYSAYGNQVTCTVPGNTTCCFDITLDFCVKSVCTPKSGCYYNCVAIGFAPYVRACVGDRYSVDFATFGADKAGRYA